MIVSMVVAKSHWSQNIANVAVQWQTSTCRSAQHIQKIPGKVAEELEAAREGSPAKVAMFCSSDSRTHSSIFSVSFLYASPVC